MLTTVRSTVAEELAFHPWRTGAPRGRTCSGGSPASRSSPAWRPSWTGALPPFSAGTAPAGYRLRRHPGPGGVLVLDEPLPPLDAAGVIQVRRRRYRRRGAEPGSRRPGPFGLALAGPRRRHCHGQWPAAGADTGPRNSADRDRDPRRDHIHVAARPRSPSGTPRRSRQPRRCCELEGVGFSFAPVRRRTSGEPLLQDLGLAVRSQAGIVAITGRKRRRQVNTAPTPHQKRTAPPGLGGSAGLRNIDIAGLSQPGGRFWLLFQQPRDQLFERTVLRRSLGLEAARKDSRARRTRRWKP